MVTASDTGSELSNLALISDLSLFSGSSRDRKVVGNKETAAASMLDRSLSGNIHTFHRDGIVRRAKTAFDGDSDMRHHLSPLEER